MNKEKKELSHQSWDTSELILRCRELMLIAVTQGIPKSTKKPEFIETPIQDAHGKVIKDNKGQVIYKQQGDRKITMTVTTQPDVNVAMRIMDRRDQENFPDPRLVQQLDLFDTEQTMSIKVVPYDSDDK